MMLFGSCLMLPFMIVVCMVNYGGLCKVWFECCVIPIDISTEGITHLLENHTSIVPSPAKTLTRLLKELATEVEEAFWIIIISTSGSHGEVVYLYLEF